MNTIRIEVIGNGRTRSFEQPVNLPFQNIVDKVVSTIAEIELMEASKKPTKDKSAPFTNHHHVECHWGSCPGDCYERYS